MCGDCTLCCEWGNENKQLRPILSDKEASELGFDISITGEKVLKANKDGNCIYLRNGCSLHNSNIQPEFCKTFSCIQLYKETEKQKSTFYIKVLAQGFIRS